MMASVGDPVGQQRSQLSLVGLETHHAQMSWTEKSEGLRFRVQGSTFLSTFWLFFSSGLFPPAKDPQGSGLKV